MKDAEAKVAQLPRRDGASYRAEQCRSSHAAACRDYLGAFQGSGQPRGERSQGFDGRDALKNGADLDTLPDVVASPLIQRLREQKVALKSQIADLSTTLLAGPSAHKALKSQFADIDAQIRQEARKVLEEPRECGRHRPSPRG